MKLSDNNLIINDLKRQQSKQSTLKFAVSTEVILLPCYSTICDYCQREMALFTDKMSTDEVVRWLATKRFSEELQQLFASKRNS